MIKTVTSPSRSVGAAALLASLFVVASCETLDTEPVAEGLSSSSAYTGRVRLTSFLDEPDGYCFDVPGPAGSEMVNLPPVAHTCHPGAYADQVFSFNADGSGEIRWTTESYDLCFTATVLEPGSRLSFESCDNPVMQTFEYTEGAEFQLTGTDLCLQVERTGPASRQPVQEGQDAYGRGRSVNAQYTHLMRFLELRACGEGDAAMYRWQAME